MARKWTEEEKKAASEKAKARLAAQQDTPTFTGEMTAPPKEDNITNAPEASTEELLRQAVEAISMLAKLQAGNAASQAQGGPGLQNGKLTGTVEKYSVDSSKYPSPVERLRDEVRLQRFGFKENFDLMWDVTTSEYTTIDNIRMKEPKFKLDLVRIVHDEETGEVTGGRYVEYRLIMHEDPDTALVIARANGIDVDSYDETQFLNEMRYLRARDWLIECFYKAKPTKNSTHREMVINGKVVDYFEVNSENSSKIPFDQLDKKL